MGRPLEEAELVSRAQRGEAAAYEELVRMHEGIAFRVAYLIAGSASEAEEAAQDGFVKAFAALGRFKREKAFRPWLLAIVANEARNRRRAAGRQASLTLRAAQEIRPGGRGPVPRGGCPRARTASLAPCRRRTAVGGAPARARVQVLPRAE